MVDFQNYVTKEGIVNFFYKFPTESNYRHETAGTVLNTQNQDSCTKRRFAPLTKLENSFR
jgi:hypothetical protein